MGTSHEAFLLILPTEVERAMNAVIFGTGEYVTGWTGAEGSKSDKSLGVVALVHFDLRERGLIGDKIALCGTNRDKFAKPGDVCSVFTPDDSHFEIISAALDRGLH